ENVPADGHLDRLAPPDIFAPRQSDWDDGHVVVDGEVGESLLDGQCLALPRTVLGFRVEGDDAPALQAAVDVLEEVLVSAALFVDGDETADLPDHPPLELSGHKYGGVAKEVHAGLRRQDQRVG